MVKIGDSLKRLVKGLKKTVEPPPAGIEKIRRVQEAAKGESKRLKGE